MNTATITEDHERQLTRLDDTSRAKRAGYISEGPNWDVFMFPHLGRKRVTVYVVPHTGGLYHNEHGRLAGYVDEFTCNWRTNASPCITDGWYAHKYR